jgi:hypothetical protein
MGELTGLFEEARYSLHPISEEDAYTAHEYLVQIAEEISPGPISPITAELNNGSDKRNR